MRSQELRSSRTALLARARADRGRLPDRDAASAHIECSAPLAERGFVARPTLDDAGRAMTTTRAAASRRARQPGRRRAAAGGQLAQLRASAARSRPDLEHRPRQPRRARPARAGRRPADRLLDPGRPVASTAASGSARSTAPAATRCAPRSTNSISAGSTSARSPLAEVGGRDYRCGSRKIYPQVRERRVRGRPPVRRRAAAELQRGQTVQIRLTLGDADRRC